MDSTGSGFPRGRVYRVGNGSLVNRETACRGEEEETPVNPGGAEGLAPRLRGGRPWVHICDCSPARTRIGTATTSRRRPRRFAFGYATYSRSWRWPRRIILSG